MLLVSFLQSQSLSDLPVEQPQDSFFPEAAAVNVLKDVLGIIDKRTILSDYEKNKIPRNWHERRNKKERKFDDRFENLNWKFIKWLYLRNILI